MIAISFSQGGAAAKRPAYFLWCLASVPMGRVGGSYCEKSSARSSEYGEAGRYNTRVASRAISSSISSVKRRSCTDRSSFMGYPFKA